MWEVWKQGIYQSIPREAGAYSWTDTKMSTATLFVITTNWKQPFPTTLEWISCVGHTWEYCPSKTGAAATRNMDDSHGHVRQDIRLHVTITLTLGFKADKVIHRDEGENRGCVYGGGTAEHLLRC